MAKPESLEGGGKGQGLEETEGLLGLTCSLGQRGKRGLESKGSQPAWAVGELVGQAARAAFHCNLSVKGR